MRTVSRSSRLLGECLPQCMLGYTHPSPGLGLDTPSGLGLDTPPVPGPGHSQGRHPLWAWTPWADTPPAIGSGPGHPSRQTPPLGHGQCTTVFWGQWYPRFYL